MADEFLGHFPSHVCPPQLKRAHIGFVPDLRKMPLLVILAENYHHVSLGVFVPVVDACAMVPIVSALDPPAVLLIWMSPIRHPPTATFFKLISACTACRTAN